MRLQLFRSTKVALQTAMPVPGDVIVSSRKQQQMQERNSRLGAAAILFHSVSAYSAPAGSCAVKSGYPATPSSYMS